MLKEAEEKRRKEELERQKELEYQKWKGHFEVEDAGALESESVDEDNLLGRFVDYIQKRKIVDLQELAADFKLPAKDVIARIRDLDKEGRLTGIIDDQGRYVYLSMDELRTLAGLMKSRGRIGLRDFVLETNRLVDQAFQRIEAENLALGEKLMEEQKKEIASGSG